jgi:G3E family GTPase
VTGPVQVTLQVAAGAQRQQQALRQWLDARQRAADGRTCAVIAEGAFFALQAPEQVPVVRLAPGCVCCVGQTPLRVALLRLLRERRPQSVLLLLSTAGHRGRVRDMLARGALGEVFDLVDGA